MVGGEKSKPVGGGQNLVIAVAVDDGPGFEPAHEQLIAAEHQRGEVIVPAVIDKKPFALPVPDDRRSGRAISEIEQPAKFFFDGLGAHPQPKSEFAQVDVDPGRTHHLMRLHAHGTIFSNSDAHRPGSFSRLPAEYCEECAQVPANNRAAGQASSR